jgi:glutamine synthetase adenylyltransferase
VAVTLAETIGIVVAAIAALISVLAARRSRQAADEARAALAARSQARAVLAVALDAGNALAEELRRDPAGHPELAEEELRRYEEWEHQAHEAVRSADAAQLARYHAPLRATTIREAIAERLERLQLIQDRL